MPTIAENRNLWNETYTWGDNGEDWSLPFGNSEAAWWFMLLPRIHRYLPAETILEIAPGGGRWTQFLKDHCRKLIGVDLAERCVARCRERFALEPHLSFYLNDGKSLPMIADQSIDLAFSFDSLVHVGEDAIEPYLHELARVLKADGVGVIHYSNFGAFARRMKIVRLQNRLRGPLKKLFSAGKVEFLLGVHLGWWDQRMTANRFLKICEEAGLCCLTQETINWVGSKSTVGAICVISRTGSRWERDMRTLANSEYMRNAALVARLAKLYC